MSVIRIQSGSRWTNIVGDSCEKKNVNKMFECRYDSIWLYVTTGSILFMYAILTFKLSTH